MCLPVLMACTNGAHSVVRLQTPALWPALAARSPVAPALNEWGVTPKVSREVENTRSSCRPAVKTISDTASVNRDVTEELICLEPRGHPPMAWCLCSLLRLVLLCGGLSYGLSLRPLVSGTHRGKCAWGPPGTLSLYWQAGTSPSRAQAALCFLGLLGVWESMCTFVQLCTGMCAYVNVSMWVYIYVHTYLSVTHICPCMSAWECVHLSECVCIHVCQCACVVVCSWPGFPEGKGTEV